MENTKKLLRVGIVGVGNIGSAHMKALINGKAPEMQLTAVCDIAPDRLNRFADQAPDVARFSDYRDLLQSGLADAVIIATPHKLHPVIAIEAFRTGLHVLSEKPAGVDRMSVLEMNREAERSGKVFGIMFNQRTNRLFAEAKRIVSSGELGEVKRSVWIITNWYRKQCYYDSGSWRGTWSGEGGGVLLNQAPHQLDLWQWICGMPTSVRAFCYNGKHHRVEVEDDATIFTEYKNGATGVFITSTGDYPGTNRLEITGTKGTLLLEHGRLLHRAFATDERNFCLSENDEKNPITETVMEDTPLNGHVEILKNFASAVLHGTPLLAPGKDGIHELTISNAAYLSAWTGETVPIPMNGGRFLEELRRRQAETASTAEHRETDNGEYKSRWNTNW
ncbi:MAG: Gfo/Idh/MocA family oxidoreductase [Ruminococcaceae bacterium]|nr:Gfo/Idh/MocA family oxidoreductase [Oscillospiraceae bacterium]